MGWSVREYSLKSFINVEAYMAWFSSMSGLLPAVVLVLVALTGKTGGEAGKAGQDGWLTLLLAFAFCLLLKNGRCKACCFVVFSILAYKIRFPAPCKSCLCPRALECWPWGDAGPPSPGIGRPRSRVVCGGERCVCLRLVSRCYVRTHAPFRPIGSVLSA